MTKPKVALIMGSDSDYPVLAVCIGTLQNFDIEVDGGLTTGFDETKALLLASAWVVGLTLLTAVNWLRINSTRGHKSQRAPMPAITR